MVDAGSVDVAVSARKILDAQACGSAGCECAAAARRGSGRTHCVVHADTTPSLEVAVKGGRLLIHCHAGCPQEVVIGALRERGLWPEGARARAILAAYQYTDEAGRLLFEVVRFPPKSFAQRRPAGDGGWTWGLGETRRVLYGLPELLASDPAELVYMVEGEKDVDRLAGLGLAATTSPMGAGKWRAEYATLLTARRVVVLADNDDAGRQHAQDVASSLNGVADEVKVLALPGLPEHGDVTDWLAAGGTVEALRALAEAAPTWAPAALPADLAEPEHLTDLGNSARWCRQHGQAARCCAPLGGWLLWDGSRWHRDARGAAMEMGKRTALSVYDEVSAGASLEERRAISKWAVASEGAHRLEAMLGLSRSALPADVEEFDIDPWLLNVENGTLDLRTGELREPRREDMITKMAPVAYDADASDTIFDVFLQVVTDGDEELQAWLQRAIGYSLTGDMREELMVLILGPTATGKSTLLHAVADTLGDYAHVAGIETFLVHRGGGPDPARSDLTALRGVRFVIAMEAPSGRRLDEQLVKGISGGDKLRARTLYAESFEFSPQCKLWFGSNFAPIVNNLDTAIWRRMRRVPFERTFSKVDPTIKPHLRSNPQARAAILAWAVKGCLAWQRDGLGRSAIVDEKTAELRVEMNPLTEFVEARCAVGRGYVADAKGLRRAYELWANSSGGRPIGNKEWGEQLRGLGCDSRRLTNSAGQKRSMWYGIGILADGETVPGQDGQ